jgi:hypothetical protein
MHITSTLWDTLRQTHWLMADVHASRKRQCVPDTVAHVAAPASALPARACSEPQMASSSSSASLQNVSVTRQFM